MKVLSLAADQGGCAFYRIREPARVAGALGVNITVSGSVDVKATKTPDGITTVHEIITDADLIIMQRPLDNAFTSLIAQAKRQGIATIVEIDDDFEMVHKDNIAHTGMFSSHSVGPHWVRAACAAADHVTVSTPALARYALHGRYSVLRNCVPKSIFNLRPAYERTGKGRPTIGWTGTVQTHPGDLQVTKKSVGDVLKKNNLGFYVVGDGERVLKNLGADLSTPFTATGWLDHNSYYQHIGNMDLGIVPLELSTFNQCKSGLKGLEMAALGIPFVASPTREYELLEINGVGKTAKSPGDWRKHLQRWVDRPDSMVRSAKQYREIIYNEMVYEAHAQDWVTAWETAIAYRKSQP